MKVLIDLSNISDTHTELGKIAFNFGKTLSNVITPYEFHFLVSEGFDLNFGNRKILYHTEKEIKKYLKNNSFDIWHCLTQNPSILPDSNTSIILGIQDLKILKERKGLFERFRTNKLQKLINKSAAVCFSSKYIRDKAFENFKFDDKNTYIIYNGVKTSDKENNNVNICLNKDNFFFCIGEIIPENNFRTLVSLLQEYTRTYLVICGNAKGSYYKQLISLSRKLEVENNVIFTGDISEDQKTWLYRNCKAFLHPSLCEEHGTYVLEALKNGAITITSNACCLPEIGADYTHYFESFDTIEMKDVIDNSISSFAKDPQKRIRQIDYANSLSWEDNSSKYLNLYLEVYKRNNN